MTGHSENQDLLRRTDCVASDSHVKEKDAVLQYLDEILVNFTVPDLLMDFLREETDLHERDAAALVLELHAEGLIYSMNLENSGIWIIRLTKAGQNRLSSIEGTN